MTTKLQFAGCLEVEQMINDQDVMVHRNVTVDIAHNPGCAATKTDPSEDPSIDFEQIVDEVGEEYYFDDLDEDNKNALIDAAHNAVVAHHERLEESKLDAAHAKAEDQFLTGNSETINDHVSVVRNGDSNV
jgi:hypothetical protein